MLKMLKNVFKFLFIFYYFYRSVSFYHTNSADASTADQSLMSPCTTYEEDVDNESIIFEGNDTVAVHKAFQLDKHKISNGHLSSI